MSKFKEFLAGEIGLRSPTSTIFRVDHLKRAFLAGHASRDLEVASLNEIMLEAIELLKAEDAKNRKNVTIIDGVEYFSIGGNFAKNAAFYKLDCLIAKHRTALAKEEGSK